MSIKQFKRPVIAGLIAVFALAFFAGPASATESKPCKEHPTTTTTAKPKPKPTTTTVAPTTTTTEKPKPQGVTHKPVASTTTATEKPVEIETQGLSYETPIELAADGSINRPAESTAELAHTGVYTAYLVLLAAALIGAGMLVLGPVRNAFTR
jgi:hypothetical protein